MKNIELKQIKLSNNETYSYRQYLGGVKTIILVHGNLASSKFYDELINNLPEDFTVYAVDLRGFGRSTYNKPIDSIGDFVEDLKLFVDGLKLTNFDLLGWSTGGAISMLFAANYGHLVNRLFLVSSVGITGFQSYSRGENGNKTLFTTKEEFIQDKNKKELLKAFKNQDKEYYKMLWDNAIYNINKPDSYTYDIQLEESMRQRNLIDVYYNLSKYNISDHFNGINMGTGEVNNIKVPTILFHGEDDLVISMDKSKETKESIGGNARLVLIENCGHAPIIDALEILVEIISDFNII